MNFPNPFLDFAGGELFDTVLPDLVLAFAFFTAVIYGVVGPRFGHQRSAVAMSVALGLALSIGLVWWEQTNGFSIVDLGPIAAGFALIILAGVMYRSIRQVGGNWAGAAIAFGASLLVGWALGLDWHIDQGIVQTVIMVTLTVGILVFMMHRHGAPGHLPSIPREIPDVRHDMSDLHEDRSVAHRLRRGMSKLRREANHLTERPERADDVMLQLKRILPAEGWLTERLAKLRERAYYFRAGHIDRIKELGAGFSKLTPQQKRKAAAELSARYKELKLDVRLERLDKAAAANERRIRDLTRAAQQCVQSHDFKALTRILEEASKLQKHTAQLLKLIERMEARLLKITKTIARQSKGVEK